MGLKLVYQRLLHSQRHQPQSQLAASLLRAPQTAPLLRPRSTSQSLFWREVPSSAVRAREGGNYLQLLKGCLLDTRARKKAHVQAHKPGTQTCSSSSDSFQRKRVLLRLESVFACGTAGWGILLLPAHSCSATNVSPQPVAPVCRTQNQKMKCALADLSSLSFIQLTDKEEIFVNWRDRSFFFVFFLKKTRR